MTSVLRRILGGGGEKRDLTERDWMRGTALWTNETASGRSVTPSESLQLVAVFACVSLIAETIGTLPLITYRVLRGGGRERDPGHPLYAVLHDKPNPAMTSTEYREAIVGHLALRGNAYSQIVRLGGGSVELWPLRPDRMRVWRDGGEPKYLYTLPSGEARRLDPGDVWHVRGMSSDGLVGYSRVTLAREAIGLGLALEEHAARFFGNNAEPGGVLKSSKELSDEAYDRLKKSWEEAHRGLERSHRVAILEDGVEWQTVGLSGRDAQFLEQRRYSRGEIATLFRVPPHMIGDVERSTSWGTGIEQQAIGFLQYTLRPYLVRIEQRVKADLLTEPTHFAEFLVDGLLRGDLKTRMEAYRIMLDGGLRSPNDIARWENWDPVPVDQGGDVYRVPMNMMAGAQLLAEPEEPAAPGDDGGDDGAERALRSERRAVGSAASRLRIAERFERIFRENAGRIVRREGDRVRTAAERFLNRQDVPGFEAWLREFYGAFGAEATRQMLAAMSVYADAILDDAAAEVGSDDGQADELAPFVEAYAEAFGSHYAESSLGQLQQVLREAQDAAADPLEAVVGRLDEWRERRAAKVAATETVRLSGALCIQRWKRAGIRLLRWITQGSKTCRFCARLRDRVVSIEQPFANPGDQIEGDEGQESLKVQRKTTHPPIHGACRCGLRPERRL